MIKSSNLLKKELINGKVNKIEKIKKEKKEKVEVNEIKENSELDDLNNLVDSTQKTINSKKPGRPPKIKKNKLLERKGISIKSSTDKITIEFIYDITNNFKKLFNLYEIYKIHEILIEFKKKSIMFKTFSTNGKLLLNIDVDKTNHYFCKNDKVIIVETKILYKIMETINKTYTSIGFIIENNDSKMKIIFYDNEVDNDIIHNVDIKVINDINNINNISQENNYNDEYFINQMNNFDTNFDISDYPLSLEFTGNYIKKLLKNIMDFTEDFILDYHKNDNLLLLPLIKNNMETHYIFKNTDKINLKYVGTEEVMTTSCKLGYLFPIGKEYISDVIKIYAHPFQNLIFEMENDIFNLKINIEIIRLID